MPDKERVFDSLENIIQLLLWLCNDQEITQRYISGEWEMKTPAVEAGAKGRDKDEAVRNEEIEALRNDLMSFHRAAGEYAASGDHATAGTWLGKIAVTESKLRQLGA